MKQQWRYPLPREKTSVCPFTEQNRQQDTHGTHRLAIGNPFRGSHRKKIENSQPSLRNSGNVCWIHTSWICSLALPQALSTTSRKDAWGALSTTLQKDTLTRHEATLALSTTLQKDISVPIHSTEHWNNRICVAVTVALTDNFSRELGSDFYIREGVVDRIWIKVGGSKAWVESKLCRWVISGSQW